MNKLTIIENQSEFHCQFKHNQPICSVVLDPKLTKTQRFLCGLCMEYSDSEYTIIGIHRVIQNIEEKYETQIKELENQTMKTVQQLQSSINSTQKLKQQFMDLFDSLIGIAEGWSDELLLQMQKFYKYSFYDELDDYIKKENNSEAANTEKIKTINRSWMTKLYNNLNQYNENKGLLSFRELRLKFKKILNQKDSLEDEIKFKLIQQSAKQSIKCNSISFNSSGSIMISSEYQNINVWSFTKGQFELLQTLQGHSNWVQCLCYSKKQNSFVSGAGDKTIRCWKQLNQNEWISSQPYKQHIDWVMCIIMNSNEDLLFSGGSDYSIKVWKVDFDKNELQYLYSLDKHKNYVISLSLNKSENSLVSCAQQKNQIIIWEKKKNGKYEFKYFVKQSVNYVGFKVGFISENSFIWTTGDQGINMIYNFEEREGVYQENISKTIQLATNYQDYDEYFFPIIYNEKRNFIVVRHKSYIYLIRENQKGQFQKLDQLNCNTSDIYGTMTDNGEYLVFWDFHTKGYSVYELQNQ
ncbi:unnamed protein product (macronuclear) [Paramecium tetraurelia]|uniref:Uncharacterized protein n=1 Tax=Paramecium tetraurelia TaxID=5888 RepID=A0BT99_PARTE|nr:uncharacterized protein GSPATT00031998001 [Paramecium tetraurelia]CAK61766.1 unnamed protein product [Paramecium tetraurelia]|eukprot:XP_001429164.1 hypothetical protein (macronuclear) [Paramecium tetraurelia strain d4-2]